MAINPRMTEITLWNLSMVFLLVCGSVEAWHFERVEENAEAQHSHQQVAFEWQVETKVFL